MTTEDTNGIMPTITFHSGFLDIRINTGELLFPVIVLLFCVAYYVDTRGLPAESMLYAAPLLYGTVFLAIITIFGHAVSFETESATDSIKMSTEPSELIVWGVESAVADQKHPQQNTLSENDDDDENESVEVDNDPFFNSRSAIKLVLLTLGYVSSFYFVPFVFSTALFLATAVYLFGERDLVKLISYSVGFTVLLWFVFINWLQVPLP